MKGRPTRGLPPRSLFGRLVLVLVAGLTVALIAAAVINLHERRHLIEHASTRRGVEHIATTVRLFDRLGSKDQHTITQVLGTRRWRLDVGAAPPAMHEPSGAAPFVDALRADLGPAYPVRFALLGPPPHPGPHERRRHMIAVRLHNGNWLRFTDRRHDHPPPWPHGLLVEFGVLLAVMILFSLLAVGRVTRPLTMLAKAADSLGRDIRRPPLKETGPTEVRRAATAFNRMQQRLLRFLDSRLRLLTATSHDLKTPVTRLRLRAEMLEDEALREDINRDLDEMDAMLAATLAYMRGESEREQIQPLDVNALLESMTADAQALGQEVSLTGRAAAPYPARPRALRRAIENLVQNALRYGGAAEISVADRAGTLRIKVADRGPGLPESELERVFEPFYRTEGSRNRATGGTGLGLAIVRDVAETHGGAIRLANRPGGGLEATLSLPR